MENVLRLQKTGKWYPPSKRGQKNAVILRDINLNVGNGEIITVVGPSGCGKSTLLAGIGGFRPFNLGKAEIKIREAWRPIGKPDKHRGVVFQDYPVPEFLTAIDNVALGLNLNGLGFFQNAIPFLAPAAKKAHRDEALAYLEQVGLSEHAHKFPRELSGGQRQRVAIAQALAMRPEILLMDEPFSGLDPKARQGLQVLIQTIHAKLKNTIFFVTHDLEEAVYLGTRIIVLSHLVDTEPGATIVHEQTLENYKTPEAKASKEFAELVAFLNSKFAFGNPRVPALKA